MENSDCTTFWIYIGWSIRVSGVPTGATLSAGTNLGGGVWTLTPAQLTGLTLTPTANSGADFTLTVTATSTDVDPNTGATTTASSTANLNVTLTAVADTPTLSVTAASGNEDTAIPLTISSALTDTDGSEALSIRVSGVPTGATLSAGTNLGGGVWTLTPAQLTGLTVTPPANSGANFTLSVTAISTDTDPNGGTSTATNIVMLAVAVLATADLANLAAAANATGNEDTAIPLTMSSSLADTDGSEVLAIQVSGVPTGATLSAGTNLGGGVWSVTPAQLPGLTVTPPLHSGTDFTLTVKAISTDTDPNTGATSTATNTANIAVTVNAVADAPTLTASASVSGSEDQPIPISINAALVDTDGSETLSVRISGVPEGAVIANAASAGTNTFTGAGFAIHTQTTATITFVNEGAGNLNSFGVYQVDATTGQIYDVQLTWPNASLSGSGGNLVVGDKVTYELTGDGDKLGAFLISNGASVNNFPSLSAGHYEFRDSGGNPATINTTNPTLWHVADNGTLTQISGNTFHAGSNTALNSDNMAHTTNVLDITQGSIQFGFEDLPSPSGDFDFDDLIINVNIGIQNTYDFGVQTPGNNIVDNGDGSWTVPANQLSNLVVIPPPDSGNNFTLTVQATSTEAENGNTATTTAYIPVTVTAVIDGVVVNDITNYFSDDRIPVDILGGMRDQDGSEVLTNITIVGVPTGATLSAGTFVSGTTWTLTTAQLGGLAIIPPSGTGEFAADFTLTLSATLTETDPDTLATTTSTITDSFLVDINSVSNPDYDTTLASGDTATYTGSGSANTQTGGSGVDKMAGAAGNDTLTGAGGNDALYGQAGADRLLGSTGDDRLYGGSGNDTMFGATGTSTISGGVAEADTMFGGTGDDSIYGEGGNDKLFGDAGNDLIRGGDGNDILYGGLGNDSLFGDAGNDYLHGNSGVDMLAGGAGDDTLIGGSGGDTLYGDANAIGSTAGGNDLFIFDTPLFGAETVYGGVGSSWVDTIQLETATQGPGGSGPGSWTLAISSSGISAEIDAANHVITFKNTSTGLAASDVSGNITMSDGSSINFNEIEQIKWGEQ